ncbi:hypothetical protein L1049_015460 [Liquidambar formosana]|uniref:Kinetochore protein Nuf2 N-terminal domain-containing protein n=1 Tax=Liquidambar formosana TaxID=63359 RepID=A0AAP0X2J7_LIQFO
MSFTLKDLIRPDMDRTAMFVSAILNFYLHRDTKMNLLRPIVEELSLLDEQHKVLEARILQLNGEIAEYNEAREREIPLVQEVDAKVKEMHQIISGLNNHQTSLKASFRTRREQAKELEEKVQDSNLSNKEAVNVKKKLEDKGKVIMQALQQRNEVMKSVSFIPMVEGETYAYSGRPGAGAYKRWSKVAIEHLSDIYGHPLFCRGRHKELAMP